MENLKQTWVLAMLTLLLACGLASAQSESGLKELEAAPASTNLVDAAEQYKASSRELLRIQENEVSKAAAKLDELRKLVAEGLVARIELETGEQSLAVLRKQLAATQKQISDSDQMIADIREAEESAKLQASAQATALKQGSKPKATYTTTPTMLRYNGASAWSINGLAGIQSFFSAAFGQALPTSAVGQSATHNHLGYDHRNAVDVALHPDSPAGKRLIEYLESQGIPFLAFRAAIPRVATGPHIHIGAPSRRLS
jgi:hypothetical protein